MTPAVHIAPWRAWLMASRPRTLPAAVAPVLVGTACARADGKFALLPALAALAAALLLQVGANLANDYFDYVKGVDRHGRKGPLRVAQGGLIPLAHLRTGIGLTFAAAASVGAFLIAIGGWPVLAIGAASVISALAYSGGPYPFGYHGLGDLFVFLFFGLAAVCGTYYVQARGMTTMVLTAAVAVGALTTAILVVNNLRDLDEDRRTGKHTWAVIIGPNATRAEYVLLLAVAYAVPLVFWRMGWSSARSLLPWLTLPLALRLVRTIYMTTEGSLLNRALAGTANLDLLFCALFAVGLVF